jgi:hypothetical protein
MIPKLTVLAQRRAHLIADIDRERESLRGIHADIRQDLIYAGLGLMAGRLMARHAWLRTASLVGLAIVAGSRLAVKPKV